MSRVGLLLIVVVAVSRAEIDKKCMKMMHPHTMFCCTKPPQKPSDRMEVKECFGLPKEPFSTCERDMCIGKKKGYIAADGNIDNKAIKDIIAKEFENQPELVEVVKDKCLDGDISAYGPEDFCDMIKLRNCIQLQFVMQCPEFSDEGDCNGITALVEECSKTF